MALSLPSGVGHWRDDTGCIVEKKRSAGANSAGEGCNRGEGGSLADGPWQDTVDLAHMDRLVFTALADFCLSPERGMGWGWGPVCSATAVHRMGRLLTRHVGGQVLCGHYRIQEPTELQWIIRVIRI
jgi:hypothetical protein